MLKIWIHVISTKRFPCTNKGVFILFVQCVNTTRRSTKKDRPLRPRMAVTNVDVGLGGECRALRENVVKVSRKQSKKNA